MKYKIIVRVDNSKGTVHTKDFPLAIHKQYILIEN